ncbi:MAG TPA: TetR/AcrR family transcriptional regulator [Methylophilaceae bacterium]|nr:TetR/AcrR family transcriptional regulator [Methylophilaceae bacterium]
MPPKPRTEQQRLQTRTAILDAARELFIERGVEAVTMREIARRVDYSPTAIYLHFKDKEALIRELCDTDFLALAQELRAIERIADPIERLRLLGLGYVRFAVAHPNHYRLMFMTPQVRHDPETSGIESGNPEQDAYACLRAMVADAHADGCFRTELDDPDLIAQILWAGLHGVCALEIAKKNDCWVDWRNFEVRIALMQQVLMRGLLREAT